MRSTCCALIIAVCGCAPPPRPFDGVHLSTAGLYSDITHKKVANDAKAYTPRFTLWADGADKKRWIVLPRGTTIDRSDVDHWRFPVGTKFFKEFSLDGKRLETRLIMRQADTGDAAQDYFMKAFIWSDDESDALASDDGENDVRDTTHDVPAAKDCQRCHIGEPGRILGYSAVQLDDNALAGDSVAQRAVGYLHANCGHCHSPTGNAWAKTDLVLRWSFADTDISASRMYQSTIGVAVTNHRLDEAVRIVPGAPTKSAIIGRMSARGSDEQMPPLASEVQDPTGIEGVSAWITSLP